MPASTAKRLVRSALITLPWLYDAQMALRWRLGQWRGQPHEADFWGLAQLDLADRLVLDVGANLGQSIASIKLVQPRARVISFEPNTLLAPALARVAARFADVTVQMVGLGARDEACELWVPRVRGYEFRQLASVAPPDAAETAGFLSDEVFLRPVQPEEVQPRRVDCRLVTLDSLGLEPALIKIDTEGTAPAVLAGGLATIEASRPVLLVESDAAQVEQLLTILSPWGYRLHAWDGQRLVEGQAGELNSWFLPG